MVQRIMSTHMQRCKQKVPPQCKHKHAHVQNTIAAGQGGIQSHRPPVLVIQVGLQAAAEIGAVLESQ